MRGFFFLCDHAQVVNGKLYVMGGGWSRIGTVAGTNLTMFLAGEVFVSWNDTNSPLQLRVGLFTEDGVPVNVGDPPEEVAFGADLEVGRPVGTRAGAEISVPLVFPAIQLELPHGRYRWEVRRLGDETPLTTVEFEVVEIALRPQVGWPGA